MFFTDQVLKLTAVVVLVFIRFFFLGKDQKIELACFLLFMGATDLLRVFIIAQAIGG